MLTWLTAWFHRPDVSQTYHREHFIILFTLFVVAIWLRFWGLGNVGLHGDEETMAMPALSVLDTGLPLLPSGMIYPRALVQIYLMAGSVWVFGESEWALRFPSAFVGSLAVLVAFFLGKRFLPPNFNMAFVAIVALLPVFIEVSQTARMYVFWTTSLMLFAVLVFRWERDGRLTSLLLAFSAWLLAVHFHGLSIFAALLFFFPGLNRQSWRQLVAGALAFGVGWASFEVYGGWTASKYPQPYERPPDSNEEVELVIEPVSQLLTDHFGFMTVSLIIGLALVFFALFFLRRPTGGQVVALLLLATAYIACTLLHYHIGAILLLFGAITWLRTTDRGRGWLAAMLMVFFLIALVQIFILNSTGDYPGRKLIGAMVGEPSVWPTLRFAEFSLIGFPLYSIPFVFAVVALVRRQSIPDHFLYFGIAVWAQLFAIGFFRWYVPPRYVMGALPFFLLCYIGGFVYLSTIVPRINAFVRRPVGTSLATIALVMLAVNPLAVARVVNSGYDMHPDHKGAAEFLKSIPITEQDVLIAEDVLQQTYYMGAVDYWLVNKEVASAYSIVEDDQLYDLYTHTRVIGTGKELEGILDNAVGGGDVYIIGSGENYGNQRKYMRSYGIYDVLRSDCLEEIFVGRDGNTRIWRLRK